MALLGMDLGGTKLATAVLSEDGRIINKDICKLGYRKGTEVGALICDKIIDSVNSSERDGSKISSIGISVPGISYSGSGTVWAPNIPEWENYPLLAEAKKASGEVPVTIDSDRACYIMGEVWKGNARGCRNAIFLAVGTGIGAGIMVEGEVIRGSNDIAGAIGWMALDRPFSDQYITCGFFEHYASGEGIAKTAGTLLEEDKAYRGVLRNKPAWKITSHDVFSAYELGDAIAVKVIGQCIELWGMAVANLVSLFNPEKIIMGGGIFGPAVSLIPLISREASRWAQPVSIKKVGIVASALAGDAGIYGAGYMALKAFSRLNQNG